MMHAMAQQRRNGRRVRLCAALLACRSAALAGRAAEPKPPRVEAPAGRKPRRIRARQPRNQPVGRAHGGACRRDRRGQEGPRHDHRGADPGGQDRAEARPGHRGHRRPAGDAEGAAGGRSGSRWPRGAACWPRCSARCSAWGSTRRRRCWSSRRTRCPRCAAPSCSARWCRSCASETEMLIADLAELSRVAASIEAERDAADRRLSASSSPKSSGSPCCSPKRSGCRRDARGGARRRAAQGRGACRQGRQPEGTDRLAGKAGRSARARPRRRPGAPRRSGSSARRSLPRMPVPEANRLAGPQPFSRAEGPARAAGRPAVSRAVSATTTVTAA